MNLKGVFACICSGVSDLSYFANDSAVLLLSMCTSFRIAFGGCLGIHFGRSLDQ